MYDQVSIERATQLLPGLLAAFDLAQLKTAARRAMFLAMVGEESGSLRWTEEMASGAEYEWRSDLGNTQPGDGVRYKGRTFIQITGRHNYGELSKWAYRREVVPTPSYFVDHPDALASDQYVWLGPVWYWTVARPQLNSMADRHDVTGATWAVNGGMNGFNDRLNRFNHCMGLGARLVGNQEFQMDDKHFKQLVLDAMDSDEGQRIIRRAVGAKMRQFLSWDGEAGHKMPTLTIAILKAFGFTQKHDLPQYPAVDKNHDGKPDPSPTPKAPTHGAHA